MSDESSQARCEQLAQRCQQVINTSREPSLAQMIEARLSRRGALAVMAAAAAGLAGASNARRAGADEPAQAANSSSLTFAEIPHGNDKGMQVSPGYDAHVLVRWGDPVLPDAPEFDVHKQTAAAQQKQFGYNNDFLAFLPLPLGSQSSDHGLLCVNHEYTIAHLMFPNVRERIRENTDVELAAHGHSVIEVRRVDGAWQVVPNSRYARRITALETEMLVSGPAAGHSRLQTATDPTGKRVVGTLNNCAGGTTPWGTVLMAEENFNVYFAGTTDDAVEARSLDRYGFLPLSVYGFSRQHTRFNVDKEPHEPNRFGWVVEFDPYDPASVPVKRTALGRFKHEGATTAVSHDNRVAVYTGDDQKFDYLYRFITTGKYDSAKRDLLDDGVLSVARFAEDGTVHWLPLVFGEGPLTAENDFHSQADVLIETRRAADLLKATPLDRPEDVEADPRSGRVYVMLTNNTSRTLPNPACPRLDNEHGHILELTPPLIGERPDHAAADYRWEILLLAGNPSKAEDKSKYGEGMSEHGWLSCPDNCAIDHRGRLWITTDGATDAASVADGVYACDTTGKARAMTRLFFNAPRGAEMCGPCFTPDGTTLFVSVQHPGDEKKSTFADPATRWPDFSEGMPPRPSVVAITRKGGGEIGG